MQARDAFAVLFLCGCAFACHAAEPARTTLFLPAPSSPLKIQAGNLAAGDVNGDRRDDLLIPTGRALHVMLAGADADFAPAPRSPVALPEAASDSALGDINGDGKLDVVVAGHDSYAFSVLLGDGAGGFAITPASPIAARTPGKRPHTHGVALADFDGDGKLDVMTANNEDGDLSLMRGDGRGGFAPAPRSPFACGPSPYPFGVADFDGDRHLDVLVPNTRPGTLALLRGDFAPAETIKAPPNRPFFVIAGDFTGDGKPDAIATHDDRSVATVLINDGTGHLAPAPSSPLHLGNLAWSMALLDLNADGRADLLAAAKDDIRAFFGDGRGTFTPAGAPYATGKGTWRLAVGDFNGDGKADVATTCVEEGKVVVLMGRK